MTERADSASARWDELTDSQHPLPANHPWPHRRSPTLRHYHLALGCERVGLTVGRLGPGESVQHHRHRESEEVYLLIRGRAQVRIGDRVVEAEPFDAFRFGPDVMRSVYNHTDEECWWVFMGGPLDEYLGAESPNILEGA